MGKYYVHDLPVGRLPFPFCNAKLSSFQSCARNYKHSQCSNAIGSLGLMTHAQKLEYEKRYHGKQVLLSSISSIVAVHEILGLIDGEEPCAL